jgi:hypothetical protein
MITLHLQGGLGNQMFQLFAALAYSIEHGERLIISTYKYDEKERPTYWNSILKKLKDNVDPTVPKCARLCEEAFHYTPLPKKTGIMLFGYFQSYKYFDKHYETIYKRLNFKLERELIKTKYLRLTRTISLHFRIGDYIHLQ